MLHSVRVQTYVACNQQGSQKLSIKQYFSWDQRLLCFTLRI